MMMREMEGMSGVIKTMTRHILSDYLMKRLMLFRVQKRYMELYLKHLTHEKEGITFLQWIITIAET